MSDVLNLACALLACPSVTPDEAGSIGVLEDFLKPSGFAFEVERTPNGTTNAWITHGAGAPLFVFAGHVDVVSPGEAARWTTPAFEPSVREGLLYARGSSDMKGSVAAAAVAFRDFVARSPDHSGTLAMLITSDEEGDGRYNGSAAQKEVSAWGGKAADICGHGKDRKVRRTSV